MGKSSADTSKANTRKDARLVWNHSTHLPGLIPILERLCQEDGIQTITPGVIGRVKGHAPKILLRVSVPIRGGYKVIARQGKTVQEVFILTTLAQDKLEEIIAIAMKQ
ncbi:MAG TPA: metal-binding protein [Trichormus sp. M33_DOE_039]|nr:metal-binding protein [Trichormus sp. M33_DOE_039]